MVSLTDRLDSSNDRSDIGKQAESIFAVMPSELMALIERINCSESDKITCLIAYACMGLALEVAEKMGIKKLSSFLDGRAMLFALLFRIPGLIDDGIMDSDGEYSSKYIKVL
ncbi:UDP-glycosyltransferase 83A1 [Abeliophyllum distichum]|uniref:UDP-glycosyltransferase 83A1 n=1 Tax=Abeliophyllum distichum TaxID=126358 RepID=A0ABD1NVV6_9LAMI